MIKTVYISLITGLLSLFGFLGSDVSLTSNLPETEKAGNEFLVEVRINKGDVEGFARFEQSLPVGFTATARETANGKFSFSDQKIKITWMRIPSEREVVVSFAIQVGPTVSGDFNLGGKFSYIENNELQSATLSPSPINIKADEIAAGIAAEAGTTYTFQDVSLKNIDCIRQKPYLNENNEVIVNLLVNKGDLQEFGKIQEQVPRGYKAQAINAKNGIFNYQNTIVKFLWMQLPKDEQFTVSYKLIPEEGALDQEFLIAGTFSYAQNQRNSKINIAERNVSLDNLVEEDLIVQKNEAPTETTNTTGAEGVGSVIADNSSNNSSYNSTETSNTSDNQTSYNNNDNDSYTTDNTSSSSSNNEGASYYGGSESEAPYNYGNISSITNVPTPENGVGYRVQVAAGHRLVGKNYFRKLNITDDIQTEIHEGWHKYTVGNFDMYKDARDYRVYIWSNTPVHDAFVAAYNNGIRITVQEALMIRNQRWYK